MAREKMESRATDERIRFFRFVNRAEPDECWPWLGQINTHGYGCFGGSTTRAHRFAYELLIGAIPVGLTIDHLCRNRNCVNPWHMEPVTNRENVLRGAGRTAVNAKRTHCPKGHPYLGDNLWFDRGSRRCRECNRLAMLSRPARRKP